VKANIGRKKSSYIEKDININKEMFTVCVVFPLFCPTLVYIEPFIGTSLPIQAVTQMYYSAK
jgi:hypothetical protein